VVNPELPPWKDIVVRSQQRRKKHPIEATIAVESIGGDIFHVKVLKGAPSIKADWGLLSAKFIKRHNMTKVSRKSNPSEAAETQTTCTDQDMAAIARAT